MTFLERLAETRTSDGKAWAKSMRETYYKRLVYLLRNAPPEHRGLAADLRRRLRELA